MNEDSSWYPLGYLITWIIIFVGCWIYTIVAYGFLIGVGIGWFPSAIAATILSILWPIFLIIIVLFVVNLMK